MFKNKKRILLGLLSLVIVMILTSCGGEKAGTTSGGSGGENGLAQGVTDDQILVGHLGPQTGPVAIYDLIRKGMDSYFNYVNENGGVHGHKLKLVAYDDQYQPAKTVKLAKRLVEEDKVFAMLGNVCTPCNAAAQDYYVEKGIPMIMPSSGAKQFVSPPIDNYMGSSIINYRIEAKVFLDYAINKLGAKKIAVAYQNDDFGKEGYEGTKKAIKNYEGVEIVQEVNFQSDAVDLSAQAQKLKEVGADVVLVYSVPNPAANLKKAMYKIGYTDVPFIVSSVGANDLNLFDLAGEDVWNGTITSATFPMPNQSDGESMKLYKKRFSADYPDDPLAGFGQVGWAAAELFVEAVKRTGEELTWNNFLESFNTFDNWKGSMYEGVSFSKDNHYGLTSLILVQAKDGEIVPISDTITFNPTTGEISYSGE